MAGEFHNSNFDDDISHTQMLHDMDERQRHVAGRRSSRVTEPTPSRGPTNAVGKFLGNLIWSAIAFFVCSLGGGKITYEMGFGPDPGIFVGMAVWVLFTASLFKKT